MVFDICNEDDIFPPYFAIQSLNSREKLGKFLAVYSGKYIYVKDKANREDCFGGIISAHPSDKNKFCLTPSPEYHSASEDERLTFSLDNLEAVFVKELIPEAFK